MRTIIICINEMEKEPQSEWTSRQVSLDLARPLPAEQLLADEGHVRIEYKGQIYTLSQTRNGKLILTK